LPMRLANCGWLMRSRPLWIIRVGLTVFRSLPVYPDERRFPVDHRHVSKVLNNDYRDAHRLMADPNSLYSPAVARQNAMRDQMAIAALLLIVAAEAGWITPAAPETAHALGG
jgi:hypothetical protein